MRRAFGRRGVGFLALTALAALLILPAAACGGNDNGGNGGGNAVTVVGEDEGGQNNRFQPAEVTIPAGETVRITFRNEGSAIHNMRVTAEGREFSSDQIVNPGGSSTFQVKIDRPGSYRFVCDYHPEMTGTLIVQ